VPTVFGVMVLDSSALFWQPSSALVAAATVLSALIVWRCVKWGETNRSEQPATAPKK
jgi:hypothetical protein